MAHDTQTQATNGYDSVEDSGDELFAEYHETIATLPIQRSQQPNMTPRRPKPHEQLASIYTTQPTQPLDRPMNRSPSSPSTIQVPVSSPLQPIQQRAPQVPAMGRGALNRGIVAYSMAPPGTTFRRPLVASQMHTQHSQTIESSDDDEHHIVHSDSSDDEPASNIKPTVFSKGGKPLFGAGTGKQSDGVPESPEAKSIFPTQISQFAYRPPAPQKRSADDMANAYGRASRPAKQVKQMGPARALPVQPTIALDDILDWGLRSKIENMLKVLPNETVWSCQDALALKGSNVDDAMEFLVEAADRRGAIDLTGSDDERNMRNPLPAKPVPMAKRQVQASSRTIADKWSSTQGAKNMETKVLSSGVAAATPPKPKRRLLQGRKNPAPASSSPLTPAGQQSTIHEPVVVSDDDEDSSLDSEADEEVSTGLELKLLNFLNECVAKDLVDVSSQPLENVNLVLSKRPFENLGQVRAVATDSTSTTKTGKTKHIKRPVGDRLVDVCMEMWTGYEAVDQLVSHCERLGKPVAEEMKKWGFDAFGTAQPGELELIDLDSTRSGHDSGIGTPSSATRSDDEADAKGLSVSKDRRQLLKQPQLMSKDLVMKDYQVAGLNWLALLFTKNLSCILADDMGLGKTCQVIAFFAHLYERGVKGPHLVCVPGSTLENWLREFMNFCPALRVEPYYGLQDERAEHRFQLEEEMDKINVIVTTYDMAAKPRDAKFLRKIVKPVVCVYDEGHALKNSKSARYQELMKIPAQFRLLLTGTPLQNNLQELISLLAFIMPDIFRDRREDLEYIFKHKAKTSDANHSALLSAQRISRARSMMTPFILRRKKHQVLKHLPKKICRVEYCDLLPAQRAIYDSYVAQVQQLLADRAAGVQQDPKARANVLMKLRQAAIHPLLFRRIFTDATLGQMSKACIKEAKLRECDPKVVYEDMEVMTDWELHRFTQDYPTTMSKYALQHSEWMDSGKVAKLVELLQTHKANGDRTLVFSQFTMVMNILEEVLETAQIPYFRLDGSTRMDFRQDMIDEFYRDESILVFMLSTKAGGAGINLACANKVIIFDSSFNPQEDIQAENRAHRVGQTRDVEVVRLVTRGTIEGQIHALGESKLALDERVAGQGGAMPADNQKVEKDGQEMVESMMMRALGATDAPQDKDDAPGHGEQQTADVTEEPQQAELVHRGKDVRDAFLDGLKERGLDMSAAT